jgi:hypothetical protein
MAGVQKGDVSCAEEARLWLCVADAELLEMIERADADHDGEISFDEFYG